jgi:hypothetical protein
VRADFGPEGCTGGAGLRREFAPGNGVRGHAAVAIHKICSLRRIHVEQQGWPISPPLGVAGERALVGARFGSDWVVRSSGPSAGAPAQPGGVGGGCIRVPHRASHHSTAPFACFHVERRRPISPFSSGDPREPGRHCGCSLVGQFGCRRDNRAVDRQSRLRALGVIPQEDFPGPPPRIPGHLRVSRQWTA